MNSKGDNVAPGYLATETSTIRCLHSVAVLVVSQFYFLYKPSCPFGKVNEYPVIGH